MKDSLEFTLPYIADSIFAKFYFIWIFTNILTKAYTTIFKYQYLLIRDQVDFYFSGR